MDYNFKVLSTSSIKDKVFSKSQYCDPKNFDTSLDIKTILKISILASWPQFSLVHCLGRGEKRDFYPHFVDKGFIPTPYPRQRFL